MTESSLFAGAAVTGGTTLSGTTSYRSFGNVFTVSEPCALTGIGVYSISGATARPSECGIFVVGGSAVSGTDNASPTWLPSTGTGWIRCTYDGTVILEPGTEYVVAAGGSGQWLCSDASYWSTGAGASGITNGPLSAPGNTASPSGQGLFTSSGPPMPLPATSGAGRNPWIDVFVTPVGTSHTASASLVVTPSMSAAAAAARSRSASLVVAVAMAASPVGLHAPSAALVVTPVLAAAAARGHSRSGSLVVTPVLGAGAAGSHLPPASLSVVPSFSAGARSTSHAADVSLVVAPVLTAVVTRTPNPALLADWPDAERAMCDFLAPLGTCGPETPKTLQSQIPYLRVTRTGGTSDRVTDRASVSVDVFAADRDTAKAIAGQVRRMLLTELPAATAHGVIDWATVNAGPAVLPATDSDNLRLAVASYQLSTRITE